MSIYIYIKLIKNKFMIHAINISHIKGIKREGG